MRLFLGALSDAPPGKYSHRHNRSRCFVVNSYKLLAMSSSRGHYTPGKDADNSSSVLAFGFSSLPERLPDEDIRRDTPEKHHQEQDAVDCSSMSTFGFS